MSAVPPLVKKGQPIKADHYNRLAIAVRNLLRMRGGDGVVVTQGRDGILIRLLAPREYAIEGIITAVHSPNGENTAQDLTLVKYSAKAIGRPELAEITQKTPDYRNTSTAVDGEPAKVGDPCRLYMRKRGPNQITKLHVLTENTVFFECPPPAAAATSSALVTGLMAEVARLSARLGALEGVSTDA